MSTSPSTSSSSSSSSSPPSSTSSSSTCYPTYTFMIIMFLSFSNVVKSQQATEADMLLLLKLDFENTGSLDATWKEGSSPCDENKKWAGVVCRRGMVRSLRLSGFNLSGDFTVDAISDLKGLRSIDIGNNHFTGPIPDFYLIGNLKDLAINDNEFSGEIVQNFFGMNQTSKLRSIDLAGNAFTGKLPQSLVTSVPRLQLLQLQHNNFTGNIPLFTQESLSKCNLAFNQLDGEIPDQMIDKFGTESFQENPLLCSSRIGKPCPPKPGSKEQTENKFVGAIKWIVLGVILAGLVAAVIIKKKNKKKNDPFAQLGRENMDNGGMNIHRAMSAGRSSSMNRRDGNPVEPAPRKGSGSGKGSNELIMVNDERGTFGLPDLMKASAEVLGNGALGSAYKAAMHNGVSVVVKRLREMNKLHRDEFYMEMRHLGRLRHKNILPPLAYHYRKEEKLVVSEYVPRGSLLYLMHGDRGTAHAELTWPIRLKIIKGVAQGMAFLHSEFSELELPHGNLKSSNILLSADFEPLLNDYSFHQMFSTTQAAQTLFAYRSPEVVLTGLVTPKSDVFCLGIIILEVLTGKFPSQYFNNQKGGTDIVQWARTLVSENKEIELIDPEIASDGGDSMGEMLSLLQIAIDCIYNDYEKRIHMKDATSRIDDIYA